MTTLLKSAAEREALLRHNAPMPEGSCTINVLILAGGFNAQFVSDIQEKAAADTIRKDPTINNIRRTKEGVEHIPAGTQNVGNKEALATTIAHLLGVHQCNPLTAALYVVTNAANHDEYTGTAAFFDTIGRFPKEWQQRRVICNGAQTQAEWHGHVSDVQLALETIAKDNDKDTLVLDANLFFWPDFNLQKLVSNMVIRARTSLALQQLTDTDVKLYAPSTPAATVADRGQVPPLAPLDTSPAPVATGAFVPRAMFYLPYDSTKAVQDFAASAGSSLLDLAAHMQQSETIYGAIAPRGIYDLTRLFPQRYVQQHMLYSAAARRRLDTHAAADKMRGVDTINALLQECDGTGLGRSKIMDEERATQLMQDVLEENRREFDRHFFAYEASRFRGYQRPAYKLPRTFYMSEYRKATVDATI